MKFASKSVASPARATITVLPAPRYRGFLVVGLGLLLAAGPAAVSDASAFFLFDPPAASPPPAPASPGVTAPPKARKHRPKQVDRIDPAEKKIPPIATGLLQIVISIDTQRLTLYSNGVAVAHSTVSTGVPGHPTPTGVFSVIEKQRFHRSNLYSDAPMPFMQRITWSGVALHEGVVPGRPASHGCIRMPAQFARQMWNTTRRGVRVIIARSEVVPVDITHPRLFVPKPVSPVSPAPSGPPVADQPAHRAQAGGAIKTAEVTDPATATDAVQSNRAHNAKYRVGVVEIIRAAAGLATKVTDGIASIAAAASATLTSAVRTADTIAVAKKAADHLAKVEGMRKAGPISVFVSRKEKKLFVRHKFAPVFEAPVTIRDAEKPLGTHVFTAFEVKDDGAAMRWTVATMPTETQAKPEPQKVRRRGIARIENEPEPPAVVLPPTAALAALDRIEIPQEALDRISELLTPGASLVVSDQGLGPETGRGTDFIVVTR
jgi:lipoprotein-anchoring transpeptidase ErfK/SrfK